MSLMPFDPGMGKAERRFREALDRLKVGCPQLLVKGTKVSQNNVAREAGVDPSALKRSRFPALVAEIQQWVEAHGGDDAHKSPRQRVLAARAANRDVRKRFEEFKRRHDLAVARVLLLEERLVELTIENERLKALLPTSNVTPIRTEVLS